MTQITPTAVPRPLISTRKIVHISMLGFAFLLPFLTWPEAAGAATLALLFNLFLLPQLGADLRKRSAVETPATGSSAENGMWMGIILYPISVLALILIYRHHMEVAAAAWALMALGDGAAGLAGESIKGTALPWNSHKTWAGFAAFLLAGTTGAWVVARWVNPALPANKALWMCGAAALLGAAVESAPIRLDDNVTVPLICGGFIFCVEIMQRSALDSNLPYLGRRALLAIAINAAFALAALGLKSASRSGAAMGFVLGTLVYLGWGWKSFVILFAFFVIGSAATRLGYAHKAAGGIAEHHGGARSWREALANVAPGAFFAGLVITTHYERAFLIAFVAAFAEAVGDTVSSEIGQWLSSRAYLITSFRLVPVGENGGVSPSGSAAGLAAAAVIALLALGLRLVSPGGAAIALGAAVAGNVTDSVLGATLERRGLITNGVVNFAASSFAGALALAFTLR